MTHMLEPYDSKLKISTINMFGVLIEKVNQIQDLEGNIIKETETIRKDKVEMLKIKIQ